MKLAADANVLLSAVLGGRAKIVLTHPKIEEILTTEFTFSEVEEYVAILARKKRLSLDILLLAVAALPVTVLARETYEQALLQARRLMEVRDPNDADILALAFHLRIPLWSNDRDFEGTGVEQYTTARLLKRLGIPPA